MKNLLKIAAVLALIISFNVESKAQSAIGGGISYMIPGGGTDNAIGLHARGFIGLNENMEIAPGFTYYLYENATWIGINGDFHYLFGTEGEMRFYPLAGINYTTVSIDYGFGSASNSEVQFNVGGGMKMPLGESMNLFTEAKYIIGDADAIVITAGVAFNIGG